MARLLYGASPADYFIDSSGAPRPDAVATVYTASSGGTLETDLLDVSNVATTSVPVDAYGGFRFQGKDGYTGTYWIDTGIGTRYAVHPIGVPERVTTAEGTIATQGTSLSSLSTTVSGHTTSIASLTSTQTSQGTTLTSLSSTVSSHTTSIASLSSTQTSQGTTLTSLSSTVSGHTTSIASLGTRMSAAEATLTSLGTPTPIAKVAVGGSDPTLVSGMLIFYYAP